MLLRAPDRRLSIRLSFPPPRQTMKSLKSLGSRSGIVMLIPSSVSLPSEV